MQAQDSAFARFQDRPMVSHWSVGAHFRLPHPHNERQARSRDRGSRVEGLDPVGSADDDLAVACRGSDEVIDPRKLFGDEHPPRRRVHAVKDVGRPTAFIDTGRDRPDKAAGNDRLPVPGCPAMPPRCG